MTLPVSTERLTLSPVEFRDLVRQTLPAPRTEMASVETGPLAVAHQGPSDFDLNPELCRDFARAADAAFAAGKPIKPAAVLVPVIARPQLTLLFTLRTNDLPAHAGQIAFPGGKPEPHDPDLVSTALREAQEEVGLEHGAATVVGRLPAVPTPTGFMIVPFVAWAAREWTPRRTSPEVHRILTPQFSLLADPSIHRITGRGVWNGYRYELHEFAIHQPPLWGATAGMVWDLLQRMAGPSDPLPSTPVSGDLSASTR